MNGRKGRRQERGLFEETIMLETAEIGNKLGKEEYKQRVPPLREELVTLQRRF